MASTDVRAWLIALPAFQRQVDGVIRVAIWREFPRLVRPDSVTELLDWNYLLLCASLLARSERSVEQRIALRIADTCLQVKDTTAEQRIAAAVVLDTMANHRTIELAVERETLDQNLSESLPFSLRADFQQRSDIDLIVSGTGARLRVNRFQRDFWDAMCQYSRISASAPTSAGKSFLLRCWTHEYFRNKPNGAVVFAVPTRALIQEISDAFAQDVRDGHLKDVDIHTLPLDADLKTTPGNIFVLTQERLHILLGRDHLLTFDVLVVDEAQKIGDGHRGVLLEQVLHECLRRRPDLKVIFASPFVENPEYLLESAPVLADTKSVQREVTTVSQNLLFISQEAGNPRTWNVIYRDGEKVLPIGQAALEYRPTTGAKHLSAVAFAMRCEEGGNLVYANGQAEAEKYATHLAEAYAQQGDPSLEAHPRIADLIKLIGKTVHVKYALVETLKQGVAFHYGNMPLLLRVEIESLFRQNILRFLVCTSTLMEGVNLPCKVIFMRAPRRGKNIPLPPADFWNLAGRAGRWGTEFQGTIACIDPEDWAPPVRRVRQSIRSVTETAICVDGALLAYAEQGFPAKTAKLHPEYDYTASFLFALMARGAPLVESPAFSKLDSVGREQLRAVLEAEFLKYTLTKDFIFRNPGILPAAMMQLQRQFGELTPAALIELCPVLPESRDAVKRYFEIFKFIDEKLRAGWTNPGPNGEKRLWQLSYLAVEWMRGKPLAYLIKTRERIAKKNTNDVSDDLPKIIRSVMSDVETYARFQIPRFLRAYMDVLDAHSTANDIVSPVNDFSDIELWLELGVSVRTSLSLMELGLSRTAAIELFETAGMETEMNRDKALEWLKAKDLDTLDLPNLVKEEIRRVRLRYQA